MNRTLLRLLPIPALVAAVAAAGVVLATQPWEGEEAAAGTIKYRLCDTVVEGPLAQPGGQTAVLVGTRLIPGEEKPTFEIRLLERGGAQSEVSIDAETASVLTESYAKASHRTELEDVLGTARREPFDPETAGWPYTDTSQLSSEPRRSGAFQYRQPDPASGIQVSHEWDYTPVGEPRVEALTVENCHSTMLILLEVPAGAPAKVTTTRNVYPGDEAAFQTFYDEVAIQGLEK